MATIHEWIAANTTAEHHYRFEDDLTDDGSLGADLEMETGTASYEDGPVAGDRALIIESADVVRVAGGGIPWTGGSGNTSGSILVGIKSSENTIAQTFLAMGPSPGSVKFQLSLAINGEVGYNISDGTSTNQYNTFTAENGANDGDWHLIIYVQPADGSGVQIYKDGVLQGTFAGFPVTNGTGSVNDYVAASEAYAASASNRVGADTNNPAGQLFDGSMNVLAFVNDILTPAQAAAASDAFNGIAADSQVYGGGGTLQARRRKLRRKLRQQFAAARRARSQDPEFHSLEDALSVTRPDNIDI